MRTARSLPDGSGFCPAVSLTETPLDLDPLDRDPLDRDPPGQRPLDRDSSWADSPGQRPPAQRAPLDRDLPGRDPQTETPDRDPRQRHPGQRPYPLVMWRVVHAGTQTPCGQILHTRLYLAATSLRAVKIIVKITPGKVYGDISALEKCHTWFSLTWCKPLIKVNY